MKIKIFRTLILLFVLVSSSSAQEKMFKIQFGLNIDSTTEAESVADIYLTKDYLRIENKFIDTSVQISDFKKQIAYILDYSNKNYYEQGLTTEDAVISPEDFQIEFIANASKSIAGYACKKAIIKIPIGTEEEKPFIEVWYTTALPKMYWGEYTYLEKIPGAALSISAYEMEMKAIHVTATAINPTLFEVPKDFEEVEEEAFTFETTELGENRQSYYDEDTELIGVADTIGNAITPAKYSLIHAFIAGYAVVVDGGNHYGLINNDGKEIIPCQYEHLARTEDGLFLFSKNDRYGYMNIHAQVVIPATYTYAREFENGHAVVTTEQGSGVIDSSGKIIIPTKFELIHEFSANTAVISEQDKYYLIDQQGKKISEAYDFLSNGGENLWLNMRSEKYGFIDAKGKQVIPSKYIYAAPFDAGLSLVSENGEDFFYIDTKGKFVQKMDNE